MDPLLLPIYLQVVRTRSRERWSRARLLEHQQARLRMVRAHALARTSFYPRYHGGDPERRFETLPSLTKAQVMEAFDDIVVDRRVRLGAVRAHVQAGDPGLFRGRYRVVLTSGTTGEPGVFVFDRRSWIAMLAAFTRSIEIGGCQSRLTRRLRTAVIGSTHATSVSRQFASTYSCWWTPISSIEALDPLAAVVDRLNAARPDVLLAYTSSARLLAGEQVAGRLRIRPRWVFVTGEVLTPHTRRQIVAAWGVEPVSNYTASETGDLGVECAEAHRMHLAEDTTVIEAVDEENRPVPPGTWSAKVLVTPLRSRIQPLIRYELSDQILLSPDPCPCGRPFAVIEGIRGRVEERVRLPALAGGSVDVHRFVLEYAIDDLPITGFQVRIEPGGSMHVRLENFQGNLDEAWFVRRLDSALREQGADPPRIVVEHVARLDRSARGKAPAILVDQVS